MLERERLEQKAKAELLQQLEAQAQDRAAAEALHRKAEVDAHHRAQNLARDQEEEAHDLLMQMKRTKEQSEALRSEADERKPQDRTSVKPEEKKKTQRAADVGTRHDLRVCWPHFTKLG